MALTSDRLAAAVADRYRVEREIGVGGMATVYLAHDLKHDRDVALKVLRSEVAEAVGGERFLREIQLVAKLTHPHILPLFDSGRAAGLLFYVMPAVEGQSLRDRLNADGQLPVAEAVHIASEVAGALDYAHRHGVVHRDIKPENIMLQDGHALVADFGIGKALGGDQNTTQTWAGATVGTPAYMSLEQAAGEQLDGRSDIYSLGCVLYEMLTGEQPFTGPTVQAVIAKRFVQTPADITALRKAVPRAVARVVQRALARTPIDRFENGGMLVAALAKVDELPASATPHGPPERSIAVLPFANMSTDPENEFFADGVTEEILNALSQLAELRVAGRTSSFSFKGKSQDLRAIGEQLNVRTVLQGSVRRSGKRVRITAQLTDVADGYHLWSEKYDREVEDVFAVQDEIASAIAGKMQAALHEDRVAVVAQRATDNIEAYEAYLKARALLYKRGNAIGDALVLMQRATLLDPGYGLAWAGVADAYVLFGAFGMMAPEEASRNAREAANRALELAPDLAEAHAAIGMVSLLFDWDWDAAERSLTRSLELNPGYVQGLAWYASFFLGFASARWQDARTVVDGLQGREPLSGYVAAVRANCDVVDGDPTVAIQWAHRAVELSPDSFLARYELQAAHYRNGDWDRSIQAGEAALAMSGRHNWALLLLAHALIAKGDSEPARAVYDELCVRARREPIPPGVLGVVAAALGDTAAAIAHAREAYERRDPSLVVRSLAWRQSRAFREIPEVQQILSAMKLPGWKPGADGWPA